MKKKNQKKGQGGRNSFLGLRKVPRNERIIDITRKGRLNGEKGLYS